MGRNWKFIWFSFLCVNMFSRFSDLFFFGILMIYFDILIRFDRLEDMISLRYHHRKNVPHEWELDLMNSIINLQVETLIIVIITTTNINLIHLITNQMNNHLECWEYVIQVLQVNKMKRFYHHLPDYHHNHHHHQVYLHRVLIIPCCHRLPLP